MSELFRLRKSEGYGACNDARQPVVLLSSASADFTVQPVFTKIAAQFRAAISFLLFSHILFKRKTRLCTGSYTAVLSS